MAGKTRASENRGQLLHPETKRMQTLVGIVYFGSIIILMGFQWAIKCARPHTAAAADRQKAADANSCSGVDEKKQSVQVSNRGLLVVNCLNATLKTLAFTFCIRMKVHLRCFQVEEHSQIHWTVIFHDRGQFEIVVSLVPKTKTFT